MALPPEPVRNHFCIAGSAANCPLGVIHGTEGLKAFSRKVSTLTFNSVGTPCHFEFVEDENRCI